MEKIFAFRDAFWCPQCEAFHQVWTKAKNFLVFRCMDHEQEPWLRIAYADTFLELELDQFEFFIGHPSGPSIYSRLQKMGEYDPEECPEDYKLFGGFRAYTAIEIDAVEFCHMPYLNVFRKLSNEKKIELANYIVDLYDEKHTNHPLEYGRTRYYKIGIVDTSVGNWEIQCGKIDPFTIELKNNAIKYGPLVLRIHAVFVAMPGICIMANEYDVLYDGKYVCPKY